MKNIFLVIILMIGVLASHSELVSGTPQVASVLVSSHPVPMAIGIVSGPPQVASVLVSSHPVPMAIGIVSGTPQVASVLVSSHPVPMAIGIVSGPHLQLADLVSAPPADLITASLPETTISASVSSSIEATVGDLEPVAKGNFFTNNWGALLMGLLGFADLVTRLTPSVKDNSILNFLNTVLNAIIPNLKKGGGRL